MDKEIWKKVFSTIPNSNLIQFIHEMKIQVKGFREINSGNIKVVRKRVINEMLKPKMLISIVKSFESASESEDSENQQKKTRVRDASVSELLELYEEGGELHMILGGLYCSKDDLDHAKAEEFERALLTKYGVKSLEKLIDAEEGENDRSNETNQDKTDWKKKWGKTDAAVKNLKQIIEELENKNSQLRLESRNEKQNWIREKSMLQQSAANERTETKKYQDLCDQMEAENKKLKEEIKRLKSENNDLHARLLCSRTNVAGNSHGNEGSQEEEERHVLLIGDPKNRTITESKNPTFEITGAKDSLEKDLDSYREVWMLDYLVPLQIKRKIMERTGGKVKEFQNYILLKSYMERGRK